jgi:hypothetical protein
VAGSEGTPAGTPRPGARRAAKPKRTFRPELLGLPLGSLAALAAWAALVWVAVDAGRSARGGDSGKWIYLGAASLAAAACLFLCLWLATLTLRRIGILEDTRRPQRGHRH